VQPERHPIQERRAHERRSVLKEQNDLEDAWLYFRRDAISEVTRNIAQEVYVKNMILMIARIHPDIENKIFGI
jgi:hypothetical protein